MTNTPEIRCIIGLWGLIKKEYSWEAEFLDQLRTRILFYFKKVVQECVQKFSESTQRRIDSFRR